MLRRIARTFCAAVAFALIPAVVSAGNNVVVLDDIAKVDVLAGWKTQRGTHMAAIRVRLAPGWKTYWRAPGEAGIPPRFDWGGSHNLGAVQLHWPTPQVFDQNGMTSVGYAGELVLPVELTPRSTGGGAMRLQAEVDLGVCEEVCIPVHVSIQSDLSGDGGNHMIRASLADQPQAARAAGVGRVVCEVEPIDDGLRLSVRIDHTAKTPSDFAVVELPDPSIWVSEAALHRDGNTLVAVADLVPPTGKPFPLERAGVRVTLLGGSVAADIRGCTGR